MNKLFKSIISVGRRVPTKDELYIRDIVDMYLRDTEVDKRVRPLSNEYYLLNKKSGISIKISHGAIEISSPSFLYKKDVSANLSESLIKRVRVKIEEEVEGVDKELFKSEIDLLRGIFKLTAT